MGLMGKLGYIKKRDVINLIDGEIYTLQYLIPEEVESPQHPKIQTEKERICAVQWMAQLKRHINEF